MSPLFILWFIFLTAPTTRASFIRGWKENNDSVESFLCNMFELDGMLPPDSSTSMEPETEWICVKENEVGQQSKTFFFDKDVKQNLEDTIPSSDETRGITKLIVPWDAVNGTTISSNHSGITVFHGSSQRQRHLASKNGYQKVLIVRVLGHDARPKNWIKHLIDGFFNPNENNLSTRYKECSNGNLNLIPATGPKGVVINGVMNLRLNQNIAGMHYMSVNDVVQQRLNQMSRLDYRTKVIVMPDQVDFKGGAGWATLYGETMWLQDKYSKFPMVQIHEYGHILGLHHSGKGDISYADDTGYMGNRLPWTEDGAITCFNPAKTWYLMWFQYRHLELNPIKDAFKDSLFSLDAVITGNAGTSKMIVKVIGDYNEFFIMYNRAKGVNRGAVGYRDKVVVTRQNFSTDISYSMAGLGDGEEWSYNNFGGTNRKLIVKNCSTDAGQSDEAKVIIYVQGLNDQFCPGDSTTPNASPVSAPVKSPNSSVSCSSDNTWYDSGGSHYNCAWYEGGAERCKYFGHKNRNFGKVANEACCICGGGNSGTVSGSNEDPNKCQNYDSWYDFGGKNYDCKWYEGGKDRCKLFGYKNRNFGKVASEACCICGGGK